MGLNGPIFIFIFLINYYGWYISLKIRKWYTILWGFLWSFMKKKIGNYELSHMKWVLDWGSLLFMMTKYFIFSIKLISLFFTARGRMEYSYRIWSLLTLVITHISIFLLRRYLFHNWPNTMSGVKWVYYRSYIYKNINFIIEV